MLSEFLVDEVHSHIENLSKLNKKDQRCLMTPLLYACTTSHPYDFTIARLEVIKHLLSKGADPTLPTTPKDCSESNEPTTLHTLVFSAQNVLKTSNNSYFINLAIEAILNAVPKEKQQAFLQKRTQNEKGIKKTALELLHDFNGEYNSDIHENKALNYWKKMLDTLKKYDKNNYNTQEIEPLHVQHFQVINEVKETLWAIKSNTKDNLFSSLLGEISLVIGLFISVFTVYEMIGGQQSKQFLNVSAFLGAAFLVLFAVCKIFECSTKTDNPTVDVVNNSQDLSQGIKP